MDFRAAAAESWDVPGRRLAGCGRWAFDDYIDVRGKATDDGLRAYPVGVQTCGRMWDCIVCSAKIRTRRQLEVTAGALAHAGSGGSLLMLTLTMRHHQGDDLATLMDALKEAKRSLEQTRTWKAFKKHALTGTITATEVTYGRNGWHPHLHVLLFIKPGILDPSWMLDGLGQTWANLVAKRLSVSPSLEHGTHLTPVGSDAAKYVAKIGAEVARSDLKGDSRSPWHLLDAVADGETWAIGKWEEYQQATKGRRAIRWSPGLKKELLPDVADVSDEEAALEDVNGVLLDAVPKGLWRTWATTRIGAVVQAVLELERYERAGIPPVPIVHPVFREPLPPGVIEP